MSEGCAVIVPTRNRAEFLRGGLLDLIPTLRPQDELLVVDSCSDNDDTLQVGIDLGVRVVKAEVPGAAIARNLGVSLTTKPILVFTDDDTLPQPGWIDALERSFDTPEIGMVLGQVMADVDEIELAKLPFNRIGHEPQRWVGTRDPNDMGVGACMAFRREAWLSVGGMDERMGPGTRLRLAEDDDLFYRVLRQGWVGRYEPDALVLHRDWRTRWEVARYGWAVGLGTGAFVAKVARTEGLRRALPLLKRRFITDGVIYIARSAYRRWELPVIRDTLKLAGTIVGLCVGAVLPMDGGKFRRPPTAR
ncbi:MAG: hypothetical protein QOF21_2388 [Actinomycetota bacterium]|jgi:GT2 family glycosyltransferase